MATAIGEKNFSGSAACMTRSGGAGAFPAAQWIQPLFDGIKRSSVAQTWSFLQSFKSMRHILPYPQSLQLQAKTRRILHKLLQLLWHRSPFGPDVYPFFLSLTPLTDAPFSLSPQTPCLYCFSSFFYVEHLVLTAKYPHSKGWCWNPIFLCHIWFCYCITKVKDT